MSGLQHHEQQMYRDYRDGQDMRRWLCAEPDCGAALTETTFNTMQDMAFDSAALAELLIAKGVITEAEYLEAIAAAMEREAARYESELSQRLGTNVTLA